MALLTNFLKLFKWNTEDESDLEREFDIDQAMNENWDKLDEAIKGLDTNKVDKVDGKGLSTNDFTNEDKEKLDGLENYDDTEITQEIEDIQEEQAKQNEDIEDLKQINAKQDDLIQKLKDNSINVTTEEATSLHVENASTVPARLEVRGNHSQEVTETAENVFNGKLELGAWSYNTGEKTDNASQMRSTDYIDVEGQTQISIVKKDGGTFTVGVRYYADDKTYIGRASISNVTDATTTTIVNNLDDSKTVKYATLTFTHSTDTSEVFGVNKGADLTWHDFIPNSPSLDYPSEVRAVGDNVNIFDKDNINKVFGQSSYEVTDNGIKISSINSNEQSVCVFRLFNVVNYKGKKFTLRTKWTVSANNKGRAFLGLCNEDGSIRVTNAQVIDSGESLTYTIPDDLGNTEYLALWLYSNTSGTANAGDYVIYEEIKVEEGEEATSYSPYGQGSVEVKKINKNFYKLDIEGVSRSGVDYTTRNGTVTAKRTATAESGSYFNTNRTKLPAGTYVISGVDDAFVYANARIEVYTSDTIDGNATQITTLMNTRLSYKYTSDKPFYLSFSFVVTGETDVNDTFIFKPQAEKNVATDFEEHKEQSLVLDIQKPMLKGDYFVKEANGWKEVHGWNKEFFANIINNAITSISNMHITIQNFSNNKALLPSNSEIANIFSNVFKPVAYANIDKVDYGIGIYYASDSLVIRIKDCVTLEDYKNALNNEDFYFYYKLATSTKLPCTESQSNVLDQLNELGLFAGTNNIITAERLALIQMQYIADTVTYIDNRIDEKLANINQQILEIAGGK